MFLTHGMVAWIEALSTLSRRQTYDTEDMPALPITVQPEITTVLANMVLMCIEEAPG
jgi:hypothetical protein